MSQGSSKSLMVEYFYIINLLMFWLRLLDTKDGRGSKQTVEAIAKATIKGLPRGTLRMCENPVQLPPNECLSFFA